MSVNLELLEALKDIMAIDGHCAITEQEADRIHAKARDAIAHAEAAMCQGHAREGEQENPWKQAVIERLVVAHIYSAEHENDPLKAILDLLAYESDLAVDPRVSAAAARLVEAAVEQDRQFSQRSEPRNFCPRCGKRLRDGDVHTCTPPMEAEVADCAGVQNAKHLWKYIPPMRQTKKGEEWECDICHAKSSSDRLDLPLWGCKGQIEPLEAGV